MTQGTLQSVPFDLLQPSSVTASTTPLSLQSNTMFDSISGENIVIPTYLSSSPDNLIFHYNNVCYPINKENLNKLVRDKNFVKFKCHSVSHALYVTENMYDNSNPYLLGTSFGCPCGLIPLSQLKTVLSETGQLFGIVPSGTSAPSTVSYQMTTPRANAVGASHCQEGQGADINTLVKHAVPDFSQSLATQTTPDVEPPQANIIKVNYKDSMLEFPVTNETTIGELKQLLLSKLVEEGKIDNVNKNVRFLFSGKIYSQNPQKILEIPSIVIGSTFNVMISNVVTGGNKTKRRRRK
jgi:hypothetical protein